MPNDVKIKGHKSSQPLHGRQIGNKRSHIFKFYYITQLSYKRIFHFYRASTINKHTKVVIIRLVFKPFTSPPIHQQPAKQNTTTPHSHAITLHEPVVCDMWVGGCDGVWKIPPQPTDQKHHNTSLTRHAITRYPHTIAPTHMSPEFVIFMTQ